MLLQRGIGDCELLKHSVDGRAGDADGLKSTRVAAQRRGNVDLHAWPFWLDAIASATLWAISIWMGSSSNFLSSSPVPHSRKEFVVAALPCSMLVMTYEHPSQWASAKSVVDHCAGWSGCE